MKNLVIIGGGEHASVVIEAALSQGGWKLIGYVDKERHEEIEEIFPIEYLGTDDAVEKIYLNDHGLMFVMGLVISMDFRLKLIEKLNIPDENWATIIHKSATISPSANIYNGVVILNNALVNTAAQIGKHAIINSHAIVEHHVHIGENTHIAPGAIIGGGCVIERCSFVGLGAKVRDHIKIGRRSTVGTGAVVVCDIKDDETVTGIPARPISKVVFGNVKDICISPNTTLLEAMAIIGKYGTMIALITDDKNHLDGIITDGDIRRIILDDNRKLEEPVHAYMNRKFHFVYPSVGRLSALEQMESLGINQLPIIDTDRKIVGIHLISNYIGKVKLPNVAVIMAGGKGMRLRPITETIPKPMVKVAGRPILEHIIAHLVGQNIRKIYISLNYLGHIIEDFFADGASHGCEIKYLKEDEPLGTAGALKLIPEQHNEPIIVLNGDLITQFDVERLLNHHNQGNYDLTIGAHEHVVKIPYGVMEMNDDIVSVIHEKPEKHFTINAGVYVIEPKLLEEIPKNQEFQMTSLIGDCLKTGKRVSARLLEGEWLDVGHPKQLETARGN